MIVDLLCEYLSSLGVEHRIYNHRFVVIDVGDYWLSVRNDTVRICKHFRKHNPQFNIADPELFSTMQNDFTPVQ